MLGGGIAGLIVVALVNLSIGGREMDRPEVVRVETGPRSSAEMRQDHPGMGVGRRMNPDETIELPLDPYSSPLVWLSADVLDGFDLDVVLVQDGIRLSEDWSTLLGLDNRNVALVDHLLDKYNSLFRNQDLQHRRITEESDNRTAFVIDSYPKEGDALRRQFEEELSAIVGAEIGEILMMAGRTSLNEVFYGWGQSQREFELIRESESYELRIVKGGQGSRVSLTGERMPFLLRHLAAFE